MRLDELAQALDLPFEGDPAHEITGLAGLSDASPQELSFVASLKHSKAFGESKAGAFLLPKDFEAKGRNCLRAEAPYVDFARAVDLFYPPPPAPEPGVHPQAVVASDAMVGKDVAIGPFTVVGPGARVGDRTILHPHVTVYPGVEIGSDCEVHSGVHLREGTVLGDRVSIQNGTVVGSAGFGFAFQTDGRRVRIPHRCAVEIGDETEIGANCTIDASHPGHPRWGHETTRTRIGKRVKIDNLVQIAHGVDIGDGVTLCGKVGLSGSTKVGNNSYFGGASYSAGQLEVGDGVFVMAHSALKGNVASGRHVGGAPEIDASLFTRVAVSLKRLPDLLLRVRRIEDRLGMRDKKK